MLQKQTINEGKVADILSKAGEQTGKALEDHLYLSGIGTAIAAGAGAVGLKKLYKKSKQKMANWANS